MKKLGIIAIGIPGSGKTTLLRTLAERYGLLRISRDDIRTELLGNPLDRTSQEQVLEEANRRMRTALSTDQSVILDSTFTEKVKRQSIVNDVRKAGATRVIGIVFETPLETAKERNRAREHVVDEDILEHKHAELSSGPPSLDEGFDAIYASDDLQGLEEKELSD